MELVANAFGKAFHRLGEGEMIDLHKEVDDIPTLAATKAVEVTLGWGYMKGRTLLIVKRAEALLLSPASTFELNKVADDIVNRAMFADVGNVLISNAASHMAILGFRAWRAARKHLDR